MNQWVTELRETVPDAVCRRQRSRITGDDSKYIVGYLLIGKTGIETRIISGSYYYFSIEINDVKAFEARCDEKDGETAFKTYIHILKQFVELHNKMSGYKESFPQLPKKEKRDVDLEVLLDEYDYDNYDRGIIYNDDSFDLTL